MSGRSVLQRTHATTLFAQIRTRSYDGTIAYEAFNAAAGDVVWVMACAVPAAGQGTSRPFEFFAGAGVSRMGGDEGSHGSGPAVVAGLGYRVTRRLSVEVDLTRAKHERNIAGGL
jgi:hypothetical protein